MKLKILKVHSRENEMIELSKKILSKKYDIYVFGTNSWAIDIMNFIDVKGFINEFSNDKYFNNKPVIKDLASLPLLNSIVISCNILGRPWTVKQKLDKLGIINIDYFSFWRFSGLKLIDNRGWNTFKQNFDISEYNDIYLNLEDLESKRTLENIINFRLTQDLTNMKFYTDRQFYQYFEPFLSLNDETFVDIGGFDGFTSELFSSLNPNFKKILFFEPNDLNLVKAKKRLQNIINKVDYYQLGVGLKKERLRFSQSGSSSVVSIDGETIIDIDTLDNILINYPEKNLSNLYIKMDIEGWEMNALMGAENIIRKYNPKLAICVYHKPNDFVEIFNYLKRLNPNYKIYLRHYTEGEVETVMYFVP